MPSTWHPTGKKPAAPGRAKRITAGTVAGGWHPKAQAAPRQVAAIKPRGV